MSSEKGFFGQHNEQHEFNAPPPNYAATTMPSSGFRIALNSSVRPI